MSSAARKEREFHQREQAIIQAARDLLLAEGYLGLTMDRVAELVEYSKPTVYAHFASKEDLILGVCNDGLAQRAELFLRAVGFLGRSRETFCAVGVADEVFVHAFPEHAAMEQLLKSRSLWERAGERQHARHDALDRTMMGTMHSLIGRALAEGDLQTADSSMLLELGLGMKALALGTHLISALHLPSPDARVALYRGLRRNEHRLLDGWGWRPLTNDWDWAPVYDRIYREVFPSEVKSLPDGLRNCIPQ
ncbi:MAG: TetR/AcrR family transcriptional regulator [Candidatus Sumerlaeia bacterium]|nr:TetR/AcrR family transcriptional regulator [Candidatus Sumerlaeia bacterium]